MIYGKLPIVFLGVLASEKKGSINSVIASYILDNLEETKKIGIQQFALNCHVSVSSISRFCRDIGLENFFELKLLLTTSDLEKGPKISSSSFLDRVKNYNVQTISGIQKVTDSLDETSIKDIVQDLIKYKKVAVFGLMKAETSALILQSDLLMYGKIVYTNLSFKEQVDYIMSSDKEDLIILFSFTSSYFDYIYYKKLKKINSKIWMITGSSTRQYPFICNYIKFKSDNTHFEHPSQLSYVATIIAQEYNYGRSVSSDRIEQ